MNQSDPRAASDTAAGAPSKNPVIPLDSFDAVQLLCDVVQDPSRYPDVDINRAFNDLKTVCKIRDEYQCFAEAIFFKDVRFYGCFETGQRDGRFDVIIHYPQVARQIRRLQLETRMVCTSIHGRCQEYNEQENRKETSKAMKIGKERVHLLLMACHETLDELFVVARDGHPRYMRSQGKNWTLPEKWFLSAVLESLRHSPFPNLRELHLYLPLDLSCFRLFNLTMASKIGLKSRSHFLDNLSNLDHFYIYIGGNIHSQILSEIRPLADATRNLVLRINDFKNWNKRYTWDLGNVLIAPSAGESLKHLEINKTVIVGFGGLLAQLRNLVSLKVADCLLPITSETWGGVFVVCQASRSLLRLTIRRSGYTGMGPEDGWTCELWQKSMGWDENCGRALCTANVSDRLAYANLKECMKEKERKWLNDSGRQEIGNGEDYNMSGWHVCLHK